MKFFIAFAAIAAVAVASPVQRALIAPGPPGPTPIVDDVSPIAIGPAVLETSPISVGPTLVESNPISVGPALIDFPLPIVPESVHAPAESVPMVQIIVNIQQATAAEDSPIAVGPVVDEQEEAHVPGPVNVVDNVVAPVDPIQVVNPIVPEPIQVVHPIVPGPVNVVDNIVVEPVAIGTPIIPAPAVVLPEELN